MKTATNDISDLIFQARGGDTAAFGQIVRRYQGLVSGLLFSATGDFHKSEDLAQETFLIAWNKLGELENTENPAPWLCAIARNLVNRSFRKKSVDTVHGSLGNKTASAEPEPSTELQRREQSELVWSVIGEMDEKYRETLILYYRSGQSVAEIAEMTALTEETVRQRLVRARKSLKSKLEEMIGDILTDTAPGDVFTLTVMTGLGAAMISSTAQAAIAGTAATSTAVTVGAGGATGGKTLGAATIWSVIGPVAYAGWFAVMFLGMFWAAVRNAPTLRARRFRVYSIFWCLHYYVLFSIACGLFGGGFFWMFSKWLPPASAGAPIFLVFFPLAMLICLPVQSVYYRKMRGIVKNDLGLPGPHVESYTFSQVERRFFLSLFTNVLVFEILLTIVVLCGASDGSICDPWAMGGILAAMLIACLVAVVYYKVGRYFLEICRTKSNFLAAPPLVDNPFEIVLWKAMKAPGSVDHLSRAGKMSVVFVVTWIGMATFGIWYFSHYSWDRHPVAYGFCVLLLTGLIVGQSVIPRRIKDRKTVLLLVTLTIPLIPMMLIVMERLEFGTFSFLDWSEYIGTNPQAALMIPHTTRMILLVAAFTVPLNVFRYFRMGREDQADKLSGEDRMIREAIDRFDPVTMIVDEQPIAESKPFPKLWLYGIILYAIGITMVMCLFVLIPNPYTQRYQLKQSGDYTALIALEPNNPEWYRRRSWSGSGRTREERLADLDTAIRLKSDYPWAYLERATLLAGLDSGSSETSEEFGPSEDALHRALADINETIRLQSNAATCWQTRARIYERLGNLDAAVDDLAEAIRLTQPPIKSFGDDWLDPRIFLYEERGHLNEARQDYHAAIADYTTAVKLIGNNEDMMKFHGEDLQRRCEELYEKLGEANEMK